MRENLSCLNVFFQKINTAHAIPKEFFNLKDQFFLITKVISKLTNDSRKI
jgi:hypothetical protein